MRGALVAPRAPLSSFLMRAKRAPASATCAAGEKMVAIRNGRFNYEATCAVVRGSLVRIAAEALDAPPFDTKSRRGLQSGPRSNSTILHARCCSAIARCIP